MKKNTAVIGLGNPLMSDEGIGGFLIERLAQRGNLPSNVDLIDAGTSGMKILHLIENRNRVIFLDCAYMQCPAGSIKRFTCDDVESVKHLAHQSLHEGDLMHLLAMARQLGFCPEEIIFFGIEPASIELGQQLSAELLCNIDQYVELIAAEVS
jgi:hydrogenase maturation protease